MRLLSLLALALLPALAQAQFVCTTNAGVVTITEYTGSAAAVTVPSTTNSLPVTAIGEGAFAYCFSVTRITVPNSITNIGAEAFVGCFSLTNITIGSGVVSIGNAAFDECESLLAITVDAANAVYSSLAGVLFNDDQTTLLRCPGGKTGTYAIPSGVSNMVGAAFDGCGNLVNVSIPSSVTNVGESAFDACSALTNIAVNAANPVYSSLAGVLFNKDQTTLVRCPGGKAGGYVTPAGVANIEAGAFDSCNDLTRVTITNSVIGIGSNAFGFCYNLTNITVAAANPVYSSLAGVLFNKDQTTLVRFPHARPGTYAVPGTVTNIGDEAFASSLNLTNVTVGSSVSVIGEKAFFNCSSLASVVLPNGLAVIGDRAFYACSVLTGVMIPPSVTTIGSGAFSGTSLARVTIPNSVTTIGDWAFLDCSSLSAVTVGSGVTNVGYSAFRNCTGLTAVYFRGDAPDLGWFVFDNADAAVLYHLPGTTGWGTTFGGRLTMYPTVVNDGDFGLKTNVFGFNITGTNGLVVVVEASTNLTAHGWVPLKTNTLTGGLSHFNDLQSTNQSARFYRLNWP